MSNFSTFFPVPGGGGGGGILKQHTITTSGTLDLTTLGIADGNTIGLFLVGGGSGGSAYPQTSSGGQGGAIWRASVTIGIAGTITASIGAGGSDTSNGGATTISGGGIPSSISTGASRKANSPSGATAGFVWNGGGALLSHSSSQQGIDGYGIGGTYGSTNYNPVINPEFTNTGRGGASTSASNTRVGYSGVLIIFYL